MFYGFEDMLHEQIRIEREARDYYDKCIVSRTEYGPENFNGRQTHEWHRACEGLYAVKKIAGRVS